MNSEDRIAAAVAMLERMIARCENCRGTNSIRVLCINGVRLEACHVCKPLRQLLALLAG